ncbi:MAG: hypothetical protein AB7S26_38500 [Sandaracinaceae bacterium]
MRPILHIGALTSLVVCTLLSGCDASGRTDAGSRRDASSIDAGGTHAAIDGGPCGACTTAAPFCDETSSSCVECLVENDCASNTAEPHCDTTNHVCVACTAQSHCTEPAAARCTAAGACAPCDGPGQCTGIAGTEVCDNGTCVECTAVERSACNGGMNVCDAATNTCSARGEHSADLCQECVVDDECQVGQLCIPMTFMSNDVGNFCLWREDAPAGPNGSCANVRPYAAGAELVSVDTTTARVCGLALTTCPALNDFRMRTCTDGMLPGTTDDECGVVGLDDGLCRFSMTLGATRCTVPCGSDDDCKSGFACSPTAPSYCQF